MDEYDWNDLAPTRTLNDITLSPPGTGHNASLISAAAEAYRLNASLDETIAHLTTLYERDPKDVVRAVQRVWKADGAITTPTDTEDAPPSLDEERLLRFRRTTLTTLEERSPSPTTTVTPLNIIMAMFDQTDIVNIQRKSRMAGTLFKVADLSTRFDESSRSKKLVHQHFLNPSTFKNLDGVPNPLDENKVATRCNANVKERPWMVLEIDSPDPATVERFTSFAMTMAKFAPLTKVVDTGGRSLHFWFSLKTSSHSTIISPKLRKAFFNLATLHGADRQMAVLSQIARLANTEPSSSERRHQRLLYWDPEGQCHPTEENWWNLQGFEAALKSSQSLPYYYHKPNVYFGQDANDEWQPLSSADLRHELIRQGYRGEKVEGEQLTPADEAISQIRRECFVRHVIPAASGRHSGYYEENSQRFLTLSSPHIVTPSKGPHSTITSFLRSLFVDEDQYNVFLAYLSESFTSLRNKGSRQASWRNQSQMLFIIGPANSGKTLLRTTIMKPLMGNRESDGSSILAENGTTFNAAQFGAELLYFDDSNAFKANQAAREHQANMIKGMLVGGGGEFHGKHRDSIAVRPWWRMVRFMNEEPHTIATLPVIDPSTTDKLIFLRTNEISPSFDDPSYKEQWLINVAAEMPGFAYFLERFQLPTHLREKTKRFKVPPYKDQTVMNIIAEVSPSTEVLTLICHDPIISARIFSKDISPDGIFRGTSSVLYDEVLQYGTQATVKKFMRLTPTRHTMTYHLKQCEEDFPLQVMYSTRMGRCFGPRRYQGKEYWRIEPVRFDRDHPIDSYMREKLGFEVEHPLL